MTATERLQAIQERLQRGDLDGAIDACERLVEVDSGDWPSIATLADLYIQRGELETGVAHLTRVADHYLEEGFHAKAAALYRRVLKLVESDQARLSLADIAARQGLLTEARDHLMVLERQRRARGDLAGADECLASLDAILEAQHRAAAATPPADSTRASTESPAPDESLPPPPFTVAEELPLPVVELGADAPLQVSGGSGIAPAPDLPAADPQQEPGTPPAARAPEPAEAPSVHEPEGAREPVPRARGPRTRSTRRRKAPALGDVFAQLRTQVEGDEDLGACHLHFDRAQQHLRDGNEEAAVPELERAARAPTLRFVASAQLGRLHLSLGRLAAGIEWLDRAAQVPPISPDEGHAVLYELADALDRSGEVERALGVFMRLLTERRAYRDVGARIEALSEQRQGDRT